MILRISRLKMRRRQNFRPALSESGQAILEYILILVIVIGILGGIIWQFNSAFRAFAGRMFGDYLACLLETGELPVLGGSGNAGVCATEMAGFNLDEGRQLDMASGGRSSSGESSGGGAGSSSGKNGSSGADGANGQASGQKGKSDSSGSGGGGGGGETVGSNQGGSIGRFLGSPFKPPRTEVTKVGTVDDKKFDGSGGGIQLSRDSRFAGERKIALDKSFSYYGGKELQEREREKPAEKSVGKADEGGAQTLKPKRLEVKETRSTAKQADQEETEFSIAGMLRILLIAAILIAMVLFIGGQLLQFSKAREKG